MFGFRRSENENRGRPVESHIDGAVEKGVREVRSDQVRGKLERRLRWTGIQQAPERKRTVVGLLLKSWRFRCTSNNIIAGLRYNIYIITIQLASNIVRRTTVIILFIIIIIISLFVGKWFILHHNIIYIVINYSNLNVIV